MSRIVALVLVFYCCSANLVIAQNDTVAFEDKETHLWGFRDQKTKKIIIPPKYEFVNNFYHKHGIVSGDEYKYGVLHFKGDTVVPFRYDMLEFETKDPLLKGLLKTTVEYEYYLLRDYYINLKCNCVPVEFYSCPYSVQVDTSETPLFLRYIQRAENALGKGEYFMALNYADAAIAANKNSAFPYFWKASLLNYHGDPFYYLKYRSVKKEINNIEPRIDSLTELKKKIQDEYEIKLSATDNDTIAADSIEKYFKYKTTVLDSTIFQLKKRLTAYEKIDDSLYVEEKKIETINNQPEILSLLNSTIANANPESDLAYSAYALKYNLSTDRKEKRKIQRKLLSGGIRKDFGENFIGLIAGYGAGTFQHAELSAGYGAMLGDHWALILSGYVGAGYEYGITQRIDAFKINFTLHSPLHIKLFPILYTDYVHWKPGFRPEIGLAINTLSFSYGYSFANREYFSAVRGHLFTVRLLIPVLKFRGYYNYKKGTNAFWEHMHGS